MDTDASIELGASARISTGEEERVTVSSVGHVGINKSAPRTNTQFEVTADANSPYTLILDGSASTAYDGRSGIRMYNGSFVAEFGTDPNKATYGFSGGTSGGSQIISDGGMAYADIEVLPQQWVKIRDELHTGKITSAAGAADDASIEIGASVGISTGGKKQFTVNDSGTIGQGYNGQPNIGVGLYTQYATSSECNAVEWGVCAFPVFDAQPASNATVFESQPAIKSEVRAVVSHFKATDARGGNEDINNTQMGFVCDSLTKSTTANYAFVANVNKEIGKNNYQFICNGDAPSSFRGEVICGDGLQTGKITSEAGAVGDGILEISNKFLFKKGLVNKFEVCGNLNAVRLLDTGTEAHPCLAFNYSDIGFYFAPDEDGDFTTANSGIAFTIGHPNLGVESKERIRFCRDGDIATADDYVPPKDQSVATKKYVDEKIWVGTTSEYNALATKNPQTLYCLTD